MATTRLSSSDVSLNQIAAPTESFLLSVSGTSQSTEALTSSSMVYDSNKNLFIVGRKADSNGGLVVKTDKYGTLAWAISFRDSQSYFYAYPSSVDSSGNIYVPVTQYNSTSAKVGVVKFNSSGALQFQRTMSSSASSTYGGYAQGSLVDTSGNFYVYGFVKEQGSSTTMPYVAKFDSSGTVTWQRRIQTTSVSSLDALFTGGSGVLLSDGSIVLGGYNYTNSSGTDYNTILVKYNSSGTLQWQKAFSFGTNIGQQIVGTTTDSSDNIYALVYSEETPAAAFLLKYNSSGTLQWQRRISRSGVTVNAGNFCITTAADGNVVVAVGATNIGIFLLTYNPSGTLQWTKKVIVRTGVISINISGLEIDSSGYLHLGLSHSDFTSTGNAPVILKVPYGNLTKDLNGNIVKFSYQYVTSTGEITDAAGSGTEPSITFSSGDFSSPYSYSGTPGNNNNISLATDYYPSIIKASLS